VSTILNTNGATVELPTPGKKDMGVTIITASWNPAITGALAEGARSTLIQAGVKPEHIISRHVPGTVELVHAAAHSIRHDNTDAVIVIGCVIRGDTPHFDYVCQIAAQGVAMLNATENKPVIFGVLTVENLRQASDRAGGALGNKGAEAAVAAIEMVNYKLA